MKLLDEVTEKDLSIIHMEVVEIEDKELMIFCSLDNDSRLRFYFRTNTIEIEMEGGSNMKWAMKMLWSEDITVPIEKVEAKSIHYAQNGHAYSIEAVQGNFVRGTAAATILITPDKDKIILGLFNLF